MTRLEALIELADKKILNTNEKAEMVRLFWEKKGKTVAELKKTVNMAYAMAKSYDSFGGSDKLQKLDETFDSLGSSDFKVLYASCR